MSDVAAAGSPGTAGMGMSAVVVAVVVAAGGAPRPGTGGGGGRLMFCAAANKDSIIIMSTEISKIGIFLIFLTSFLYLNAIDIFKCIGFLYGDGFFN